MKMKKSTVVVCVALLSLLQVLIQVAAREDPSEIWARSVQGESLPEAIEAMFDDNKELVRETDPEEAGARTYLSRIAKDFDTKGNAIIYHSRFTKDFDVKPNAIIYHSSQENKA